MRVLRYIKRIIESLLRVRVSGYPFSVMRIVLEREREQAWFFQPAMLRSIIEKYRVDLAIDVGANRGLFVDELRRFYKGPIISFEPVVSTFQILSKKASRDKNWYVFNYALGNKSEEQYITVFQDDQLSSVLETNEYIMQRFKEQVVNAKKELIKMRRFDDIVSELPFNVASRRILLKLDTQGYDLEVFKGARSIWENLVALQSEVSQIPLYHHAPHWTESIREYEKAGLKIIGLYPVVRDGLYYISSDVLMVR
jgi:FkbM family methyltransferase